MLASCCDKTMKQKLSSSGRSCERGLEILRLKSCCHRHFHPASASKQASIIQASIVAATNNETIQPSARLHNPQTWLISQKAILCTVDSSVRSCPKSISQRSSCPLWTRSLSSCPQTMSATQSSTLIRAPYVALATRVIDDCPLTWL